MAVLSSRDGKLNVLILLVVVQILMLGLYMQLNVQKPACTSIKAIDIKQPYTDRDKSLLKQVVTQPIDLRVSRGSMHGIGVRKNVATRPPLKTKPRAFITKITQPPSSHEQDCGSIPPDQELETFQHDALALLYHNYVNSIQYSCSNIVRHGTVGDGGWDVCVDQSFNIKKPCTVYSFGIKDDWSFDESITTKYGCQLHAYDPSITGAGLIGKPNIKFHRVGLDGANGLNMMRWKMLTFNSMLKENGHSQTIIDVLKIDIEGSEWQAFPQMLKSGSLKNVRQFCFEIHIKLNPDPEPDIPKYMRGLRLFKDLYHAGFRIFKTHKNPDTFYHSRFGGVKRTGCHEINMVRINSGSSGCQ